MSELSIKVSVAGRTYPLTIQMDEEENIRKAAQRIDKSLQELQQYYAVKDKQDLLAMTALQIATENLNMTQAVDHDLVSELKSLEQRLESLLKQ